MSKDKENVLFICSQNWHRSKTAETIFSKNQEINAKSAGTNSFAETPLSNQLLEWADTVLVMEPHHKEKILQKYASVIKEEQILVLDILDKYHYMDPELIEILKEKMNAYLSMTKDI